MGEAVDGVKDAATPCFGYDWSHSAAADVANDVDVFDADRLIAVAGVCISE